MKYTKSLLPVLLLFSVALGPFASAQEGDPDYPNTPSKDMDADMPKVEIVATARKKSTFVATHRHEDMYTCFDQCIHKIEE